MPRCTGATIGTDDKRRRLTEPHDVEGDAFTPAERKKAERGDVARCRDCRRAYDNFRRYNVLPGKRESMSAEQDHSCAICTTAITADNSHLDHDHESGAIRGLLCQGCNPGLGHFKEDPNSLLNAVAYLRKHDASTTRDIERLRAEVSKLGEELAATSTPTVAAQKGKKNKEKKGKEETKNKFDEEPSDSGSDEPEPRDPKKR